jgi:hypothetical protein
VLRQAWPVIQRHLSFAARIATPATYPARGIAAGDHPIQGGNMFRIKMVAALAAGLPMLAMAAGLTNSNIDTRTTTNVLSFSDLAFDNLDKQRTDRLQFHGAVGDSGKFTIEGPFGPDVAVSVVPGRGMGVSNQSRDPATEAIVYRAAITGTTARTITQSWNVSNSASMKTGVGGNGLHYLEFIGNNTGFLKAGGVFDYSVTLPGDWSRNGTGTGDSELLALNPEFSVMKDFVFDPLSDTTTLEVLNAHYDVNHPNVGLDFKVFGVSAVSEPLSPALLLAGLGLIGVAGRRRVPA